MTLGPVRVMGAGVVMMMCVEEVMCDTYCANFYFILYILAYIENY